MNKDTIKKRENYGTHAVGDDRSLEVLMTQVFD